MKKRDNLTFEKKILRLEEISELLESEETELEEALKLFEEGIELSKDCITTLKNAELKITELKKKIEVITNQSNNLKMNKIGDD